MYHIDWIYFNFILQITNGSTVLFGNPTSFLKNSLSHIPRSLFLSSLMSQFKLLTYLLIKLLLISLRIDIQKKNGSSSHLFPLLLFNLVISIVLINPNIIQNYFFKFRLLPTSSSSYLNVSSMEAGLLLFVFFSTFAPQPIIIVPGTQ